MSKGFWMGLALALASCAAPREEDTTARSGERFVALDVPGFG